MFSTGAGGDIKIALLNEEGSQFRYGDLEDCRRFGTIIGAEAIKVAEGIETVAVKEVSAKAMTVDLPFVDPPSVAEVERELDLVVRGRPGWSTTYSLTLERQGAAYCAPDGQEGPLGNGDRARAAPLGVDPVDHTLCPGDEDWFAVRLPAGVEATVRGSPSGPPGELDLSLESPEGDVLAEGEVVDDRFVVVRAMTARPGTHYLRARGSAPDVRLADRLSLETVAAGGAETIACAAAPLLVPGEPLALTPVLPVDVLEVSCGQGGVDHVARFELAAPGTVTLVVSGAHFGTGLAVRADCDDVVSEVDCVFDEEAALEGLALGGVGPWFVVVEVGGGQRPELLLTTQ